MKEETFNRMIAALEEAEGAVYDTYSFLRETEKTAHNAIKTATEKGALLFAWSQIFSIKEHLEEHITLE